jgi:hypothetical protein
MYSVPSNYVRFITVILHFYKIFFITIIINFNIENIADFLLFQRIWSYLSNREKCCLSLEPTAAMLSLFNSDMYGSMKPIPAPPPCPAQAEVNILDSSAVYSSLYPF